MANNLPRLLPLVFVAVVGVLAMKVITSAGILPDVFHKASAFAADTGAKGKPAKTAVQPAKAAAGASEVNKSDDPTQAYAVDPGLQATAAGSSASDAASIAAVTPVCATSVHELAQQAGMSDSELQILQSLGTRRAELDAREAQLDSRGQLIQAADDKLDARIAALTTLKTQIQALLDQASKTSDTDTNRLVAVYSAMKPKDAAAVLTSMNDDVRLPIAAGLKDRTLAAILGAMDTSAAKELTEKLANRMKAANGLQDRLDKLASSSASSSSASSAAATPVVPVNNTTAKAPAPRRRTRTARPAVKAPAAPVAAGASASASSAPAAAATTPAVKPKS